VFRQFLYGASVINTVFPIEQAQMRASRTLARHGGVLSEFFRVTPTGRMRSRCGRILHRRFLSPLHSLGTLLSRFPGVKDKQKPAQLVLDSLIDYCSFRVDRRIWVPDFCFGCEVDAWSVSGLPAVCSHSTLIFSSAHVPSRQISFESCFCFFFLYRFFRVCYVFGPSNVTVAVT
jgi:hypothetical protein